MTNPQQPNAEQVKAQADAFTSEAKRIRVGQDTLIKLSAALGPLVDAVSDIIQHQVDVDELRAQQLDAQAAQLRKFYDQMKANIVVPGIDLKKKTN